MPGVTADCETIDVPDGATVPQACEFAGEDFLRFRYRDIRGIAVANNPAEAAE